METTTEELFRKLVELPIDVVAIILSYLPKCMLPHLLYFPPIRNVVATCILSNVKIVPIVSRHSKNYHLQDVCEGCTDGAMPIELSKLKKELSSGEYILKLFSYAHWIHLELSKILTRCY